MWKEKRKRGRKRVVAFHSSKSVSTFEAPPRLPVTLTAIEFDLPFLIAADFFFNAAEDLDRALP